MFPWISFMTYVFITAFTPGPNNLMSLSNGTRFGIKKSLPFNLGIFAGTLTICLLAAFFSAGLFNILPAISLYMKVIGAAYILYLAYKTLKSSNLSEELSPSTTFRSGAFVQILNPKLILYAITSMSTYVLPYFKTPVVLGAFALLLSVMGLASTLSWLAFGSFFKRVFTEHAKAVNLTMALLLVYCAVALFY